ncbi:uncharacterized protein LOC119400284 [Rhipicephalus sanguineus]|uniref:Uncharacterized protein n=1 Tax=Rhipicephalus sanguineus TaxID=34632 RepID=A0A9D4PJL3_RHISA|nr:uncharacterized protein LOC119400284 [Rhipicephalus sanguineus]KAH7942876.1 hypothetical protein HPB52_002053 [Rhipicephalus sanguineus]
MDHKMSIGTEQLYFDELNQRFSGLNLNVPCSAEGAAGEDGGSVPTSICHIFDRLSRWNYVLWHVGLQLRELRGPGRLSLVRVVYKGGGGCTQQTQSHHARILLHVLLVKHSCVESLDLDDVLMEGGGLGECRELVVSALRKNTTLQTLTLCSLYEYKSVCADLFGAVGTMTNLHELTVLGSGLPHSFVQDAVCPLLVSTTCLTTLSIPGIIYIEETGTRLVDALLRNETVENLSVHASIASTCLRNGFSEFSHFLANSARLTSLSVQGVYGDPNFTYPIIESIVPPLVFSGKLRKLRLWNFRLTAECAGLLAVLVSRQEGCLESLDIGGCCWSPKGWPERWFQGDLPDGEHTGEPAPTHKTCPWIRMFDSTAQVQLSFFALSFEELRLDELRVLLDRAAAVASLRNISLSGVPLNKLKKVCRVIRKAKMFGRVRIDEVYYVDSSVLAELQCYPEALSKMAITSFTEPCLKAFAGAVQLACTCFRVTQLELNLTQEFLSDVLTFRTVSEYLSTAVLLNALWLTGCDDPDLSRTLRSAGRPYSVLLEAIFKNVAIQTLRLNEMRLGEDNLRFLVDEVAASKSLCQLVFASWDPTENGMFVRLLAAKFWDNKTISYLRVLERTDCVDDEWFVIEDIIGRNTGYLTCAAHCVLRKDDSPRCTAAFGVVSGTPALMRRVEELRNKVQPPGPFRRTSGA